MNQKIKEIRSEIIGMAVIKTLAQTNSDVHIHYCREGPNIQLSDLQPQMMPPVEKFTMNRDEFRASIFKTFKKEEEQQ